jgi:hypothetical protein
MVDPINLGAKDWQRKIRLNEQKGGGGGGSCSSDISPSRSG